MDFEKTFGRLATKTSQAAGRPWTFCICVLLVVAWAASGPLFKFSETWQLVINTGTTIITFLMVFLIQNTQNRDSAAIQAKLDDLILTSDAENKFIGIEKLTDKELDALRAKCAAKARAHASAHERVEEEVGRRHGKSKPAAKAKAHPAPGRGPQRPSRRKAA